MTAGGPPEGPFHEGELQMQSLNGVQARVAPLGRAMIRDHLLEQHRAFFAQLPWVVVGGLDAARQPWATVWAGPPGFMQSPDVGHLGLQGHALAGDPLAGSWQAGSPIALLGLEPHTRRRNRLNGVLSEYVPQGCGVQALLQVHQSFGNCPKYIQPRQVHWVPEQAAGPSQWHSEGPQLSARAQALIAAADTFFVASASLRTGTPAAVGSDGVDVSHRGGPPGFVQVVTEAGGPTTLLVPDYSGNNLYNTLGNLLLNPRVGLLFLDLGMASALWLAGTAQIEHEGPTVASLPGAQRLLRVCIEQGRWQRGGVPLSWA